MVWFVLFIAITVNVANNIVRKNYSISDVKNVADSFLVTGVSTLFGILPILVSAFFLGGGLPSAFSAVAGVIFGADIVLCCIFNILALESGPVSFTTLICTVSFTIPTIFGIIIDSKPPSVLQAFGTLLLLLCTAVIVNPRTGRRITVKWLIFAILGSLSSGGLGIIQLIMQRSEHSGESVPFLTVAFITAALLSFAFLPLFRRSGKRPTISVKKPRFIIFSCAAGIMYGLLHVLCLYLAGAMESIIFFPVNNGAVLILTFVSGAVFFSERPSRRQLIAFVLGLVALVLASDVIPIRF